MELKKKSIPGINHRLINWHNANPVKNGCCNECGKNFLGLRETPSGVYCYTCYMKTSLCSECGMEPVISINKGKPLNVCRNCWNEENDKNIDNTIVPLSRCTHALEEARIYYGNDYFYKDGIRRNKKKKK